jgi:arylsulfatase A-like enzyme
VAAGVSFLVGARGVYTGDGVQGNTILGRMRDFGRAVAVDGSATVMLLTMTRRSLLSGLGAPVLAAKRPPNVIVIVADDLGWGDLTINGAPDIRTPHIDGIARAGVRFTQSYANAPECSPTRCALLTGRYQQRVGGLECAIGVNNIGRYDEAAWLQQRGELGLPTSEETLPRRFKALGYDTAVTGKWHLGYAEKHWPKAHGFDYSFGILGGNADYYTHEEQGEGAGKTQMFENGEQVRRSGYMTDLIADAALGWLKQRRTRPYFLYLPFTAPHTPIQAREDFDPKTGTAATYCARWRRAGRRGTA